MAELIVIAPNSAWLDKVAFPYVDAHNAVNADNVYNNNALIYLGQDYDLFPTETYYIYRGGLIFDTSSIPAGATIQSAVLSLMGKGLTVTNPFDVTVVSGADLADVFVVGDFGDLLDDIISLGSFNTGDYIDEDWNDITLNAVGLAAINKGGTTRFGLRGSHDIDGSPFTDMDIIVLYGTGSTGKEPKLTITYTTLSEPEVTTDPATLVGQTTATKNGTLDDDGGEACEVRFQYGETTDYGTNTGWQSGKTTGDTFEQVVRGLLPGRVYHFRAQARNSAGTANGADKTFHTAALAAEAHQALGRSHPLGRAEV